MKKLVSLIMALLLASAALTAAPLSASAQELDPGAVAADRTIGADAADDTTAQQEEDAAEADEEPEQIDYPVITAMQNEAGGVRITWDSYEQNITYRVYYRKAAVYTGTWEQKYGSVGWTRIATVTGNSYLHETPADGEIGVYTVRCIDKNGKFTSGFNEEGWENIFYACPAISKIVFDESGAHLTWKPSWKQHNQWNGERYMVYRRTAATGWTRLATDAADSYDDPDAVPGQTYIYTIRVTNADGSRFLSGYLSGTTVSFNAYPYVTSIENISGGAKLSWLKYDGAASYRVYYRSGSNWVRLSQVTDTSYTDTSVKDSQSRIYTVRALDKNNSFISSYNTVGWANSYYAPPVIKSLSNTTSGVKLTWDKAKGAEEYRVYRMGGSGWLRLARTAESEYIDSTVVSGQKYTYTIRMVRAGSDDFMSGYLSGKSITYVAAPAIKSAVNVSNGVKLTWNKVAGADFYRIYYKNSNGGWTRLASKYLAEYTDTSIKNGQSRTYTVRCLDKNEKFVSDYDDTGFTATYFAPPAIKDIEVTSGGVVLKWNRTEGAGDYRVYRRTGSGSWTRLTQTDGTTYTDTTAKKGVKYSYTLRIVTTGGDTFMSDFLSGKSVTVCAEPSFKSVSAGADGVVLKWNAVTGAEKYRIYYKNDNGGWTRLATKYKTEYSDTSIKDGTTRVYTIRCLDKNDVFVSGFNTTGWSCSYYAAPTLSSVKYSGGKYTISWKANSAITKFRVYRKRFGESSWTVLADKYSGTSYTDTADQAGKICMYTVRGQSDDGNLVTYYISPNPYYKNGVVLNGNIYINGTYGFKNGYLMTGANRVNGKLRYYNSEGRMYRDTIVGTASSGYYYTDADGICYESEDMRLAAEFMMRYCTGSTLKQRMKSGYLYLAHKCAYERRYGLPSTGSDFTDYAIDMFTNHSGDCYRYAACFAYLARIAGYRVLVAVGEEGLSGGDHGWTEVKVNGEWLYCDPESEIPKFDVDDYTSYMVSEHRWSVEAEWYSELTLKDGKVVWGSKINAG